MLASTNHVGIFTALPQEAMPIIKRFSLATTGSLRSGLSLPLYQGQFNSLTVSLWTAGIDERTGMPNIGPEMAFLSTHLAIESLKLQFVVNAGTAGGLKEADVSIGDVVVCSRQTFFHDRRSPVEKYRVYQQGRFPAYDATALATSLGLKTGIVSSGVSFDHDPRDCQTAREFGASVIDMEASSVAWACSLAGIPFLPVKVVTDLVDSNLGFEKQFYENWLSGCEKLSAVLPLVLQGIFGSCDGN